MSVILLPFHGKVNKDQNNEEGMYRVMDQVLDWSLRSMVLEGRLPGKAVTILGLSQRLESRHCKA